ncbi:hypothetical protein I7I50_12610 [Histoplasma capsulatum G186AR]|uniref:Uncharacterized protein n=1 Tax=Ajellomyces capsulatus TaxID=5037 RepID=A0A8H8CRT8_AJECA|nr:hypothetical protein I7I52_11086 [Histoplasma capsulatum]QSS70845.1 hypothetical protein I7I50_12610 [Histoplasma capsulatum G186AR]
MYEYSWTTAVHSECRSPGRLAWIYFSFLGIAHLSFQNAHREDRSSHPIPGQHSAHAIQSVVAVAQSRILTTRTLRTSWKVSRVLSATWICNL